MDYYFFLKYTWICSKCNVFKKTNFLQIFYLSDLMVKIDHPVGFFHLLSVGFSTIWYWLTENKRSHQQTFKDEKYLAVL